ncbi:type I DNA topoisomerase [Meiothermus granaticius]|uniref:DNA topoisomerase 1 n=1 Tax=Meiothermus granaticius NBRC 107808 TaxID=1227551 RepID=A0A399FDT0_9DEIN|nr:type I DNA topoisomerase [Meiothermus granaticius]RIH93011.1 DNA topoisomerase 1 [Meiothermus granaticius NBRC 107808]GEM86151.1 DNA topoisomerase 1 [Meiothermus granaticius NBRC 107808]
MPEQTLVVVESPAKAKSIAKMLGAGFEVKASKGHVADLPERDLGVDVAHDFTPAYEVKKDKKPIVDELKRAARGKRVLIATDPDREGEAIGWHVARLLGLNPGDPLRVEFHEITPRVVREAVRKPRPIDQSLVDAQQARRVLDRLVGYQLSPVLSMEFRRRALSAGRVQSVALRLIVEREQAIEAFVPQEYWTLEGQFESEAARFKAMLYSIGKERVQQGEKFLITHADQAQEIARRIRGVPAYRIASIERRERKRNPAAPFTTSTLQQAASSRMGWTASRTMRVAQRLYEGVDLPEGTVGLITYMRTDSVRVSQEALDEVRKLIPDRFGNGYLPEKPNFYSTKKAANAQDAHEAIRPTSTLRAPEGLRKHLEDDEYKLYTLIWQRFVASQMTPALFDQTTVTVEGGEFTFRAVGSVLKFDGFLKVYGREEGDDAENLLPPLRENAPATLLDLQSEQHFTEPPPRYSDASLIKVMEEMGIGRPSTYAPTIDTLERRQYLERHNKSLRPTPLGREVIAYLTKTFPDVVAYEFTAQMEARLDEIEEGKAQWPKVVREFYDPFLKDYAKVPQKLCPVCGRPLELKVSRFGQFLGCTGYPECKYTERLEVKKAPEPIGEECPQCHQGQLVRRYGRYGSFISCSRYPECNYTRDESPSTGIECPKCHAGEIVQRISKRGKPYYRCNHCDFLSFDKVLESKCPLCGWNEIQKGKDKTACSNPACERYGGPDLQALNERRAERTSKAKDRGSKARGKSAAAKKAAKEPAGPPATWADLEPLIATVGLPADQAEMARRTQGAQSAVPAAAKALGLDEAAALKLFRQALFKLRMEYGRSRKPTRAKPKAAKAAATWKDLEPFLSKAKLPPQEAEVARRTQGQQKAVPQVAKELGLPEDQTLTLFRKAMFKIRMEYGKAKKEPVGA